MDSSQIGGNVRLTESDLTVHLREQFGFLVTSALAYDRGNVAEAKRLSLTVRVLLHSTRRQASLLQQLDVLETMRFQDSAGDLSPDNLVPESPMTQMEVGPANRFLPLLDESTSFRPVQYRSFTEWWHQPIVEDSRKQKFDRKSLILTMADRDGGAHVDTKIDALYRLFRLGSISGWGYDRDQRILTNYARIDEQDVKLIPHQVSAIIRQMAHEVIRSIEVQFPALAGTYPTSLRI